MGRPRIDKRLKLFKSKNVTVELRTDFVASFQNIIKEVEEKALRPAAYAGARVMYRAMRQNVPVKSGRLHESIYHWFNVKVSNDHLKVYSIGPNKRRGYHWYVVEYGHWRYNRFANGRWLRSMTNNKKRGKAAHDIPSGRITPPQWVRAQPYIMKTYNENLEEAFRAMKTRFAEKVREIQQK